MIQHLADNPLLLLFLVAAIGYPLGRVRIKGVSLGVAAVLFAGLAAGAIDPALKLPEIIYQLGLVLFVYTVGLASGHTFLSSLRRDGLRPNLLVALTISVTALAMVGVGRLFTLSAPSVAGLFTGTLTNTPALAAALDTLRHNSLAGTSEQLLTLPVVAYSLAYPASILGMIAAVTLLQGRWRIDYGQEVAALPEEAGGCHDIANATLRVTNPEAVGVRIADLQSLLQCHVLFGRLRHGSATHLVVEDDCLAEGDLLTAIGTPQELARVAAFVGEMAREDLIGDRRDYDYRRIFVSNPRVIGRRIDELDLPNLFGAVITRLRRGDTDHLANGAMVLEPGDRIRVLTHRDRMKEVSAFFGDSYRGVSELDILTFSLGLALGLLLGALPLPLGGSVIKLGFAGGPLIVGLLLGGLGRTGSLVWSVPYGATMTVRQIGLVLFLAGIGTRAGAGIASALTGGGAYLLIATSFVIAFTIALLFLWLGHRVLRLPMGVAVGMLAGLATQPALLGFAQEQAGNELPDRGYSAVYPLATLSKILLVQLLLTL